MHFKIAAEDKTNHRYSGVLAHPTSFPSPYGVGDMGKEAYNFIDFLHMAGQHLWRFCPLALVAMETLLIRVFRSLQDSPSSSVQIF